MEESIYVSNYSSAKFLLHYQTAVFSTEVCKQALALSNEYFDIDDAANNVIELINDNDGFTVTGWYKRGNAADQTLLHQ